MSKKPFSPPMHTQFSNDAIDYIMPHVSANAWRIITVVIRKTYGWHKRKDRISFSQFISLTGIKNKSTLSNALSECLEKGVLLRHKKGNSFEYELNRNYILEKERYGNCTENGTETVPINPKNGTEIGHTKESIKEKEINTAKKQKTAESPVSTDQKETDTFLQELRERETKTTYKKKTEKIIQSPLGISNAIYAGKPVTQADMAATRGDTIESRLSGWRDDKIRMVVEAFARAFGKLPPAAPDKNAKDPHAAKYQFYWQWYNGAKLLTEITGEGDLLHIIEKLGAEYDGFDGIQSPYSIRNQVYVKMNTALETPKYTNGNRIGV